MVGSPIFAILLKWVSSAKLLCLTLLIWCAAVVLTGELSTGGSVFFGSVSLYFLL